MIHQAIYVEKMQWLIILIYIYNFIFYRRPPITIRPMITTPAKGNNHCYRPDEGHKEKPYPPPATANIVQPTYCNSYCWHKGRQQITKRTHSACHMIN